MWVSDGGKVRSTPYLRDDAVTCRSQEREQLCGVRARPEGRETKAEQREKWLWFEPKKIVGRTGEETGLK
jgi:hypothetical protein